MKWLRRKTLSSEYGLSLRKVDYVLRDMRESGRHDNSFIKDKGTLLVNKRAFELFLRGMA